MSEMIAMRGDVPLMCPQLQHLKWPVQEGQFPSHPVSEVS